MDVKIDMFHCRVVRLIIVFLWVIPWGFFCKEEGSWFFILLLYVSLKMFRATISRNYITFIKVFVSPFTCKSWAWWNVWKFWPPYLLVIKLSKKKLRFFQVGFLYNSTFCCYVFFPCSRSFFDIKMVWWKLNILILVGRI